jgi:hypothetical protein
MKNLISNIYNFNVSFIAISIVAFLCFLYFLRYVKRLLIFSLKDLEPIYKEYKNNKSLYFFKMFIRATVFLTAVSLLLLAQYFTLENASVYVRHLFFGFIFFMYSYCLIITYCFISKNKTQ